LLFRIASTCLVRDMNNLFLSAVMVNLGP
jgi:hypothetical protein